MLGSAPSAAHAYRTTVDDPEVGRVAVWRGTALDVYVGTGAPLTAETIGSALQAATSEANAATCPPPSLVIGSSASGPAAPGDGRSTIEVVSAAWTARGLPAERGATTDVQIVLAPDGTAAIVEADIYLNAGDYAFSTDAGAPDTLWLPRVLQHEALHALGLLHPCEHDGAGGAPTCEPLDLIYRESAVYPDYLGDRGLTLGPDDEAALCAVYPPPAPCAPGCPAGLRCDGGACVPDTCRGAGCSCETTCGGACSADADCAQGVCGIAGDAASICVPSGSVGARCASGNDCATLLCLTSMRVGSYCTVGCTADAECAGMQVCSEVEGRSVCAPSPPQGGCSVARHRAPFDRLIAVLSFLTVAIHARRRRTS